MTIPTTIPYFKPVLGLTLVYALLWMALEGELWRDIVLATAAVLLAIGFLMTRFLGGGTFPAWQIVSLFAAAGLVAGVALPLVTIFLMALKTGIHAHGPEYTAREIAWVWRQMPICGAAGGLGGLGAGLLAVARRAT